MSPFLPCSNLDPQHLSQSSIHLSGLTEDICAIHKSQQEMMTRQLARKTASVFKEVALVSLWDLEEI